MEEERIKDIFREYDPELSSGIAFIERLERNLNAVEMIHRENTAAMKRNKLAVGISAFVGFISGILFTLFIPSLTDLINSGLETISRITGQYAFSDHPQAIAWILIGAFSVFIAVNTYDITLSLLPSRGVRRGG